MQALFTTTGVNVTNNVTCADLDVIDSGTNKVLISSTTPNGVTGATFTDDAQNYDYDIDLDPTDITISAGHGAGDILKLTAAGDLDIIAGEVKGNELAVDGAVNKWTMEEASGNLDWEEDGNKVLRLGPAGRLSTFSGGSASNNAIKDNNSNGEGLNYPGGSVLALASGAAQTLLLRGSQETEAQGELSTVETKWHTLSPHGDLGWNHANWVLGSFTVSAINQTVGSGNRMYFPIHLPDGSKLDEVRVKWEGDGANDGFSIIFESQPATGVTTTVTALLAKTTHLDVPGGSGVQNNTDTFTEVTIDEDNQYRIVIESEVATTRVRIFSLGYQTTKSTL